MKSLLLTVSLLATSSAYAAYPFTISGEKIAAIFASDLLWKKLGGAAETIVFKGHSGETSKFAVTATESVAIVNQQGITTGWVSVPCLVLVDVTAKGDPMIPTWEVTNADFTACPKTTSNK